MANTKITNPELFNLGDSTSATQLPVMTTTQRIAMTGLSVGEMIFNSTTDKVEYWDGTAWYGITYGPPVVLPLIVDYLIIAGGGGGGRLGGGGGAGGYRTSFGTGNINGGATAVENSLTLATAVQYSVSVGAGGIGAIGTGNAGYGGNSSLQGTGFTSIVSTYGGGGATICNSASPGGGSGGGGSSCSAASYGGTRSTSPIQGFAGSQNQTIAPYPGGGGGGAGAAPVYASGQIGIGGASMGSAITGINTPRAGGGGGGTRSANGGIAMAGGGGGAGSGSNTNTTGGNATASTGSGGGGGGLSGSSYGSGGNGGSGIVILRYPTGYTASSTLTFTDAVVSGSTDRIITITGIGTGTVTFA